MKRAVFEFALAELSSCSSLVFGQGARTAEEEALWLAEHVSTLEEARAVVKRRCQGEPMAYLLKTTRLCGLDFRTDERAIIPRSYLAGWLHGDVACVRWLKMVVSQS